jgi:hypothetical protein
MVHAMSNETAYRCGICGEPVDPDSEGSARAFEGWASADLSKVTIERRLHEFAHVSCVEQAELTIAAVSE